MSVTDEAERALKPPSWRMGRSRWSEAKEAAFLFELSQSGNVTRAAQSIGVDKSNLYRRRRRDASFRERWKDAFAAAYERLEAALLQRAIASAVGDIVEGEAISFRDALAFLSRYRDKARGVVTQSHARRRALDPDAARAEILRRVNAYRLARARKEAADGRCSSCGAELSPAQCAERSGAPA